ncbi:MAG TPA: hypothetical protein VNW47_12635 [Terriglobales bacterium]|jgi:hypothetical protein|nr:hypothetical protein [Terriglobales bacterium]
MNPYSKRSKCAARAALVLAATAALLMATACGSSGSNGGGGGGGGTFTPASLSGQYVISQTGIGADQFGGVAVFSESIVFTADGKGNLNVTVDDFNQSGVSFQLSSALSGTYSIGKNGVGVLHFNSSTYGITMIDDSHFHVIQGDLFATASGFGEKQDTSSFSAVPVGTFIFQSHNASVASRVGSLAVASGNINVLEDSLTLGTTLPISPTALTGSFGPTIDANGRGTFVLSDGSTFAFYMVNASKFRFMSFSGGSSTLEIGQAEKQTGGPFSAASLGTGTYVFGTSGDTLTNSVGMHSVGALTTDGVSKLTGTVDYVQDGAVNTAITLLDTSSYALAMDGRGLFNLDLSNSTSDQKVFWMVNPTRAYVLNNTAAAIEDGTFTKQQGAPFSATSLASQSSFVMDGFDVAFKDRTGVITPHSNGNLDWNQQANSFDINFGGVPSATTTTGNYQVDASGRVTVSVNNVSSSIVFYLSSANSGVMVQEDGADIGGTFETQATQ